MVRKMKQMDRDSYEFAKLNLEVQELVKTDIDFRIDTATQLLKAKLARARQENYE